METLLGNREQKQELRFRLNSIRLFHFKLLQQKYFDIHFIPLSQFLLDESLEKRIDINLFKKGIENFYRYQEDINYDYTFLPLDRIFVGLHRKSHYDDNFKEFGGYYSKYQTYYHLEQISLSSLIGCYTDNSYNKILTTLELLRSYFHDSIHYNTFRSYKLKINHSNSEIRLEDIHRFQYGFNLRREDGKSFSNIDVDGTDTTRNLGIIMEGVTDDFSKMSVAKIIEDEKISLHDLSHFENIILNEMTSTSFKEVYPSDKIFTDTEEIYLSRINEAYKTVWKRYYKFLNEFAVGAKQDFREFIFVSMISGDHIVFKDYFNRFLNDVNGFDKLFKSPFY